MTTLIDTIKPTEDTISVYLNYALAGRSEAEFVQFYLKNMSARIQANPQLYHSYGAWWPALKTMLINGGDISLGQSVDSDTAELYRMTTDALTIVAAHLYAEYREINEGVYNAQHWMPVASYAEDTEPYLYVSYDDSIERFKVVF